MDLRARLEKAVQAARAGDHEHALREYIWFHENALEHDFAYAGVRLSFALSWWRELGTVYPPAQQALLALRDGKTEWVLSGDADSSVFHDVVAINDTLGESRATYELFVALRAAHPLFAAECAHLAWDVLVACEDYTLARKYMDDPSDRVRKLADHLQTHLEAMPAELPIPRESLEAEFVKGYVNEVRKTMTVLQRTGDSVEAELVSASASELLRAPALREVVRAALVAPAA